MANYRVLKRIQHDGKWYEIGTDFEIDERHASNLIAAQAIEFKAEPVKEDKPQAA